MPPAPGASTTLNLPVFQNQAGDAAELAGVVRDQDQAIGKRNGGDLQIIGTDRRSGIRQKGSGR